MKKKFFYVSLFLFLLFFLFIYFDPIFVPKSDKLLWLKFYLHGTSAKNLRDIEVDCICCHCTHEKFDFILSRGNEYTKKYLGDSICYSKSEIMNEFGKDSVQYYYLSTTNKNDLKVCMTRNEMQGILFLEDKVGIVKDIKLWKELF